MIKSFADKETERIFNQEFSRRLPQSIQGVALRKLIIIKEINIMNKKIPTPTIGEILKEEFMDPLDITAYKLAKDIGVPTSRVLEILHGKRKVTADTSLRLAKYFGLTDKYFLDIQNDIDIRILKENQKEEFDKIIPYSA